MGKLAHKTKLKRFDFRDGLHLYSIFYEDTGKVLDHLCMLEDDRGFVFTDNELIYLTSCLAQDHSL